MRKIVTMFLALFCFLTVKAQTTLVNEGFEVIPHSFTSSLTASVPDWDTTRVLKFAGLNSIRGKINSSPATSIVTAKFSTLGHNKVYLRFKHICKIAPADKGGLRFRVGGSSGTWTSIPKADTIYLTPVPTGNLGFLSTAGFNSSSYTQWAQTDTIAMPNNDWWRGELFNLSSFIGNKDTVEIQFRIQRGNTSSGLTHYGWLLDNVEIIASDNEIAPPIIVQQPTIFQDTIYGVGPWTINALVTDASPINTVNLVYTTERFGVPTGSYSVPMVLGTGNVYSYEIPTEPYMTKVTYYIFAQDQYGNEDVTPQKWFVNKKQPVQIIVGTGTLGQKQPFGANFGYERSAAIYTGAEIGNYGTITTLAWNVVSAQPTVIPTKIYLKTTTNTTVTAATWASLTTGATLVYDASKTFTPAGWNTIDITDFDFSSDNIMILCETNYGTTGSTTYPTFAYTNTSPSYQHQSLQQNNTAPTGSGTLSYNRPNVMFGFVPTAPLVDVAMHSIVGPPATLITSNLSDIVVKIKTNGSNDLTSVRINWSLDGVLQTPIYNWTGTLTQDQVSPDITIASAVNFTPGSHTLKVWVTDPNNDVDPNLTNDTIQKTIFSCDGVLSAGTYTVGGASPDFVNLDDVSLKLKTCGISGPVTFNVRPGTYYTNVNFAKTLGGSAVNMVTLKSESNDASSVIILDTNNSVATFLLDSVSDFKVQYLTLKKTSKQNNKLVWFRGKTGNVQFEYNVFEGLDTNVTSDNYALVYSSKTTTVKDSAIVFKNNTFNNGSIGLFLAATSTLPSSEVLIQNNIFNRQSYRGIHLNYFNKYNVLNNTIRQSTISTQSFSGLYFNYCKEGISITANKVYSTKLNCGLYLNYSKGNPLLVSNNYFTASSITSSGIITSACGLYVYSCDTTNIFNNTVNLNGIDSVSSRAIFVSLGSNLNIRNNIFANNIKGFSYFVSNPPTNLLSNYNNLFTTGTLIGSYSGATSANITAWKTSSTKDTNSISISPSFLTWDNFHTFEVGLNGKGQPLASVPTDIENDPRNTTTPDIGCDEFDVAPSDLGVIAIVQPVSTFSCGSTGVSIVAKVKNYGLSDIDFSATNATVYAATSGTLVQNFSVVLNSGILASGATIDVPVTAIADFSAQGLYTIKSWTNLTTDTVRLNDTISFNYDLRKIITYPYDVDFSSDFSPSWYFTQLSGAIAWQRIQSSILLPTIAPFYGNGMLYFPSNTSTSSGARSRAIMPTFDFTGVTRPYLEFWMSQDNGASAYPKEGVIVRISSDGGTTWNNDTLFAARYNASFTTPGWKLFSKLLTSYAGNNCVKIAFDAVSYAGNNIGIDRVVVRNLLDNDLKTTAVYAKGKLPLQGGLPDTLSAVIENIGAITQYNKVVTFDVSGANTQILSYTIDSIQPFTSKIIKVDGFAPTIVGVNTLTVSVPNDGDNTNNTKNWRLETTSNTIGYADTSAVAIKAFQGNGLLLAKYRASGSRIINNVKAYITGGTTLNKVVYGVVCNSAGTVVARTQNYTILPADTARWITFPFLDWTQTVVVDTTFYVGIAQLGTGFNPLGSQAESPVRGQTFYTSSSVNGGSLQATTTQGRFMITAELGDLPAYEVALQSITNPVSGCGVGIQPVTLVVKNFGLNNINPNEVIATYTVNGGAPISMPVNIAIPSNNQVNFSFTPADFSATTANVNYTIKAWVTHPSDIIHYNDTILDYQVLSRPMPSAPTITSGNPTIGSYNTPATITANGPSGFNGYINWYKTNVSPNSIGMGGTFVTGNLITDTSFYTSYSSTDGRVMNIVGTGTVSMSYIPFYYNYDYGWSSMLYKRSEISNIGLIDTLFVEMNSATAGTVASQKIYMQTVSDTVFANTSQPDRNNMVLVFDGTVNQPASGWMAIPLSTPYNYNGNGSLMILWENREGSYSGNPSASFKSTTIANVAKYKYKDGSFPEGLTGTMTASRTNIKFNGDALGCVSPRIQVLVTIPDIPTVEIQPTTVTAPTSGCGLHQESILVNVKNNLTTVVPAGGFIYYQVNGGTPVKDTIDVNINGGQTIPFTFSQKYDFSAPTATTPYVVKVWTETIGDTYRVNDTINYNFQSKWTATDLTLTDVVIPYGTSHTFIYPDWLRVYSNATATNQISFAQNFNTPILYENRSYWMEAVQVVGAPINVQVGNGSVTQSYVPFYYLFDYGWSSALYKSSEFSSFGTIDTVWFEVNSASTFATINNQKLYLKVVSDTVFADLSQPNRNTMTLVYDGNLTISSTGWVGIKLIAPFTYDGSGSLMVYWENHDGVYSGNPSAVWKSTAISGVTKYKYQDDSFPEGVAGTALANRPNARFTGMNISCPSPLKQVNITLTDVPAQDAGVIRYIGPSGGSYLTTTEHIKVTIKNYGTDPIFNFPVSYSIDNGAPVTEIYSGTINSLDTAQYTFVANQDLSSFLYPLSVKAYTSLSGDIHATNDTTTGTIATPVYCASTATTPATNQDIGNVTFAGINNGIAYPLYSNTTAVNGYTDFSLTVAPAYLAKGGIYPFSATQINRSTSATQGKVKVYIDYNRNGVFDATEAAFTANSTSATGSNLTWAQLTASGNITIPATALSGVTRMRVVLDDYDVAPSCGNYTYGETEDYSVIIYSATDPDAALTNFNQPNNPTRVEGNIQPVKVNLLNVGTTPITSATLKVIHNGVETIKAWTGNLATMTSTIDSITSVTLVAGTNNFTAIVDLTGDNMRYNDTIRFVLNALPRYDVKPVSVLNPIALSCPNFIETIKVRVTNVGQDTLYLANTNLVVKAQVLINNVAEYQTTVSSGILPVNGTLDVNVSTAANFSTGGSYRIRAIVYLAGDGNLANDTLLTDTINILGPVTALPAIENFETFTVNSTTYPNGWTSTTTSTTVNKYQWVANAGATQSGTASGPAVDHTLNNATGKYAYVYGGYGAANDKSSLISRCYNFAGTAGQSNRLSFWYHMFNPGTNAKMYVEYGSGDIWLTLDSLVGQQQTTQTAPWLQKSYVLPIDSKNGRIRFRAQKGSTPGDIAIDDINLRKVMPDVGVTSIITPISYPDDSVMTNSYVNIKVLIHNFGQLNIDTIPVAFKLGTNAEVNETYIGLIAPGADVEYTFNTPYQVPSPRMHYICAYTKLLLDADTNNNKSCKNVTAFPDTNIGFNDLDVAQFTLSQNIPNPASDKALIGFNMPQTGKVMFRVTDVLGRELYTEELNANYGSNSVELNTVNYAPGIYYYWIEYKDKRLSRKMNIIK